MIEGGVVGATAERAASPVLVSILADMVEAALARDSARRSGVASTQDRPAPSKEAAP